MKKRQEIYSLIYMRVFQWWIIHMGRLWRNTLWHKEPPGSRIVKATNGMHILMHNLRLYMIVCVWITILTQITRILSWLIQFYHEYVGFAYIPTAFPDILVELYRILSYSHLSLHICLLIIFWKQLRWQMSHNKFDIDFEILSINTYTPPVKHTQCK